MMCEGEREFSSCFTDRHSEAKQPIRGTCMSRDNQLVMLYVHGTVRPT